MSDLSNSSLVARCINRDRLAWDKFVERFSPLVFWAIKDRLGQARYRGNREDIEDIFQNVFVLLWEKGKLKQVKDREKLSGWLAMVAANCVYNYFRNKRESLPGKELLPEKTASLDCPAAGTIEQERLHDIIKEGLNCLSAREVIILKLNYFYNKTHQEIGRILKMPANTVSSIIKRTKEKIKEELEKQGWENF
ncbi:MAG: sigma-70 family RNA polymerase sigma factor [Candidatus Omnitrophica bacterium]|nr:sigma-70 family RNA polymerase sigma factor [Candidatus Omnitrophota bacterium]